MKFSLPLVFLLCSCYAYGGVLSTVCRGLDGVGCFEADVAYEVLLPNAESPVEYRVHLMSYTTPGDSLAPQDYLIEWQVPSAPDARGFSAYFAAIVKKNHVNKS